MSACTYDDFRPCEHCGSCRKPKYRSSVDEENNEVYCEVSYNGGLSWEDAE